MRQFLHHVDNQVAHDAEGALDRIVWRQLVEILVIQLDKAVAGRLEVAHAVESGCAFPITLRLERHDGDAHYQLPRLPCLPCDYGRRTGSGAAPHAGDDEGKVIVVENFRDALVVRLGSHAADTWVATGPASPSAVGAEDQFVVRLALVEVHRVGVDGDGLHTLQSTPVEARQDVVAGSTDTEHLDARFLDELHQFVVVKAL